MENEPNKKMNKVPIIVVAVILIMALTLVLVFLPGGNKEKSSENGGEEMNTAADPAEQKSEENKSAEQKNGENNSEEGTTGQKSAGSGSEEKTEEKTEAEKSSDVNKTEIATEAETETPVIDGAGEHKGKLGSVFTIPKGFNDVSPESTEQGYYYFYEQPEYGMSVQISEYHEDNLPVSFEMQYNVFHNLYKNDTGTRVVSDEATDTVYTIEGYTGGEKDYFYFKGMKTLDRNVVQIRIQFPAGENEETCRTFLFEILDSYSYQFISNPDKKTEKESEEITEEGMVVFDETQ